MNVYIETNFILELAFLQNDRRECDRILTLCEAKRAALVVPAFCLAESYETLGRRTKKRRRMENDLKEELRQLERSEPYQNEINCLPNIAGLLARSTEEDLRRLTAVLERISKVTTLIPFDADLISCVISCRETYELAAAGSHSVLVGATSSGIVGRRRELLHPERQALCRFLILSKPWKTVDANAFWFQRGLRLPRTSRQHPD